MKSNFMMMVEIEEYWKMFVSPENYGFLTKKQMDVVIQVFDLDNRSYINLVNLRDEVVMYFSNKYDPYDPKTNPKDYRRVEDIKSAVTSMIDKYITTKLPLADEVVSSDRRYTCRDYNSNITMDSNSLEFIVSYILGISDKKRVTVYDNKSRKIIFHCGVI